MMRLVNVTLLLFAVVAPASCSYMCDESKCRATQPHPWVENDVEFTCWVAPSIATAETLEERIAMEARLLDPESGFCADGYVGRYVESVPPEVVHGELRSWYTCCPPDSTYADILDHVEEEFLQEAEFGIHPMRDDVHQGCTDKVCSSTDWAGGGNCWADGFLEPMSCQDSHFRHPRYIGLQTIIYVQFICCESRQEGDEFMNELHVARVIWISLSAFTLVVCCVFMTSILRTPQARKSGYNMYLVFLALPDAIANLFIIVRNAIAISEMSIGPTPNLALASYEYYYAASNMWLNAVIVGQIHYILRRANKGDIVPQPSVTYVYKQVAAVYSVSLIAFGWAFFMYIHGLNAFTLIQVVNIWIATRAVMVGVPLFYILGICFDVYHRSLLPVWGKTRVLALYFLRVIVVFLITWVPYFVIYEMAWSITENPTMMRVACYLGSIQGTISVLVSLSKPDVKKTFWNFVYGSVGCSNWIVPYPEQPRKRREASRDGQTAEDNSLSREGRSQPANKLSADDLWSQDDIWNEEDLDDNLRAVLAAWKSYRRSNFLGNTGKEVVATAPAAEVSKDRPYRLKPAAPEQHDDRPYRLKPAAPEQHDDRPYRLKPAAPEQYVESFHMTDEEQEEEKWATQDIDDLIAAELAQNQHKNNRRGRNDAKSDDDGEESGWYSDYQNRISRLSGTSSDA